MSDARANVNATLEAITYGRSVVIFPRGGGRIGPVRVVQRLATQDLRNDTSVAVVLDDGQRIHLGDVDSVEMGSGRRQAPARPKAGPA